MKKVLKTFAVALVCAAALTGTSFAKGSSSKSNAKKHVEKHAVVKNTAEKKSKP